MSDTKKKPDRATGYWGLALLMAAACGFQGCSNMLAVAQDAEKVSEAKAGLSITSATGDLGNGVTSDLRLPTTIEGFEDATVSWSVSPAGYVDASTGSVTRPAYGSADVTVTLTATIAKGSMSATKDYQLTVFAEPGFDYAISSGKAVIKGLSSAWYGSSLAGKYDLVIPGTIEGYPVSAIGGKAFDGTTSLKTLTVSAGIEKISGYAFSSCSGLTRVSLPSSITSIENNAFQSCSSLSLVTISAVTPPAGGSDMFLGAALEYICVPKAGVSAYKSAAYWSDYASSICEPSGSISLSFN